MKLNQARDLLLPSEGGGAREQETKQVTIVLFSGRKNKDARKAKNLMYGFFFVLFLNRDLKKGLKKRKERNRLPAKPRRDMNVVLSAIEQKRGKGGNGRRQKNRDDVEGGAKTPVIRFKQSKRGTLGHCRR